MPRRAVRKASSSSTMRTERDGAGDGRQPSAAGGDGRVPVHRQHHGEGAALAQRAAQRDLPAEGLGETQAVGEAEAGAARPGLQRPAHLEELLEHPLLVLRGDADPGVGHLDLDVLARLGPCDGETDLAVLGEAHRVDEQVAQHLAQQGAIGLQLRHRRIDGDRRRDPPLVHEGAQRAAELTGEGNRDRRPRRPAPGGRPPPWRCRATGSRGRRGRGQRSRTRPTWWRWSGVSGSASCSVSTRVNARIEFTGERSSWLTAVKNRLFARLASCNCTLLSSSSA